MEDFYDKLRRIVEKEMKGTSPAHDINHVLRVYNLCLKLAKHERNVDLDVLKTAALLLTLLGLKKAWKLTTPFSEQKLARKF